MTRETDVRPSETHLSTDLSGRVDTAAAADADALCRSASTPPRIAHGLKSGTGELLVLQLLDSPGPDAVSNIQNQLTALGLADRGIKTTTAEYYDCPDGSTGDCYAIIRQAREENMPGMSSSTPSVLVGRTETARPAFVRSLGVLCA